MQRVPLCVVRCTVQVRRFVVNAVRYCDSAWPRSKFATERRISLASSCPRQQRRSGFARFEKEDAAGGRIPCNEAEALLREAFGPNKSRKSRSHSQVAQPRPQQGATRQSHRRPKEEVRREAAWTAACFFSETATTE